MERSNLLSMLKIAIKGLIETSMRMGRTLNDNHPQLQQFLILMELVFKHRLKCTLIRLCSLVRLNVYSV